MAINEFVARNGLIAQSDSQITGSLIVTNGVTGSFSGSLTGTASYANNTNLLDGFDSSNFTFTSSFNSYTSSLNSYTQSLNAATGAFVINSQTGSFATFTALNAYTSSINSYTSSLNSRTSSFATTGSNNFIGTQNITGSLNVSGSINANVSGTIEGNININSGTEFARLFFRGSDNNFGIFLSDNTGAQTKIRIGGANGGIALNETSGNVSIGKGVSNAKLDVSGSTLLSGSLTVFTGSGVEFQVTDTGVKIGNIPSDNHTVTGSLFISGSTLSQNGSNVVLVNQTSSFVLNSQTSSFIQSSQTGSFATTGSNTFIGNQIITGSVNITGSTTITGSLSANNTAFIEGKLTVNNSIELTNSTQRYIVVPDGGSIGSYNPVVQQGLTRIELYSGSIQMYTNGVNELAISSSGVRLGTDVGDIHVVTGSLRLTGSSTPLSYPNNTFITSFNTSGTSRNLLGIDNNNYVTVGDSSTPFYVRGTVTEFSGTNSILVTTGVGTTYSRWFTSTTGNLVIQGGGTFTDNGARLQVNATGSQNALAVSGSTNITGSLNVSGSTNIIGIQSITGSLNVTGSFNVSSASFAFNQNLSVTTGSARLISQVATGSSRAAFFDYVITSGSNARAGTVFSVWSGSTVEWNDVSTNDIGNTTDVTVYAAITGSNVALLATSSINFTWAIKSLVRTI